MDLKEDSDLFWIADTALQEPEDPPGWSQCESPSGDTCFMRAAKVAGAHQSGRRRGEGVCARQGWMFA